MFLSYRPLKCLALSLALLSSHQVSISTSLEVDSSPDAYEKGNNNQPAHNPSALDTEPTKRRALSQTNEEYQPEPVTYFLPESVIMATLQDYSDVSTFYKFRLCSKAYYALSNNESFYLPRTKQAFLSWFDSFKSKDGFNYLKFMKEFLSRSRLTLGASEFMQTWFNDLQLHPDQILRIKNQFMTFDSSAQKLLLSSEWIKQLSDFNTFMAPEESQAEGEKTSLSPQEVLKKSETWQPYVMAARFLSLFGDEKYSTLWNHLERFSYTIPNIRYHFLYPYMFDWSTQVPLLMVSSFPDFEASFSRLSREVSSLEVLKTYHAKGLSAAVDLLKRQDSSYRGGHISFKFIQLDKQMNALLLNMRPENYESILPALFECIDASQEYIQEPKRRINAHPFNVEQILLELNATQSRLDQLYKTVIHKFYSLAQSIMATSPDKAVELYEKSALLGERRLALLGENATREHYFTVFQAYWKIAELLKISFPTKAAEFYKKAALFAEHELTLLGEQATGEDYLTVSNAYRRAAKLFETSLPTKAAEIYKKAALLMERRLALLGENATGKQYLDVATYYAKAAELLKASAPTKAAEFYKKAALFLERRLTLLSDKANII